MNETKKINSIRNGCEVNGNTHHFAHAIHLYLDDFIDDWESQILNIGLCNGELLSTIKSVSNYYYDSFTG